MLLHVVIYCTFILCKLWLANSIMWHIVTLMWRRKRSEVERIRGRRWVSLFTSLSYSFQADTDRPHQSPACRWSHMICRRAAKRYALRPRQYIPHQTNLQEHIREHAKQRQRQTLGGGKQSREKLKRGRLKGNLLPCCCAKLNFVSRATRWSCWSISSLGWLPSLWQVHFWFFYHHF